MTRARGPLHRVAFRRRREGKTNYAKRLALLKSGLPRLVVRKTNKFVYVQFIAFAKEGDRALAQANSRELAKQGFPGKCNTPSAYLAGLLAGKRALKAGVKKFVLDLGLHAASKGSLVFAALKGALNAGLETSFEEEILPSEERIAGKHLAQEIQDSFQQAKQKISSQS